MLSNPRLALRALLTFSLLEEQPLALLVLLELLVPPMRQVALVAHSVQLIPTQVLLPELAFLALPESFSKTMLA
jgi:hypothetical protein